MIFDVTVQSRVIEGATPETLNDSDLSKLLAALQAGEVTDTDRYPGDIATPWALNVA